MIASALPPAARRLLSDLLGGARLEQLAGGQWHLRQPDVTAYRRVQRPAVDALEAAGLVAEVPSRPLVRRTLALTDAGRALATAGT